MFERNSAEEQVTQLINVDYNVEGDELVIIPQETIEKSYGWVFFYNSKRYLQTNTFSDRVAGNGPIVFEKETGSIHRLGSHANPLQLIQEFEKGKHRKSGSTGK